MNGKHQDASARSQVAATRPKGSASAPDVSLHARHRRTNCKQHGRNCGCRSGHHHPSESARNPETALATMAEQAIFRGNPAMSAKATPPSWRSRSSRRGFSGHEGNHGRIGVVHRAVASGSFSPIFSRVVFQPILAPIPEREINAKSRIVEHLPRMSSSVVVTRLCCLMLHSNRCFFNDLVGVLRIITRSRYSQGSVSRIIEDQAIALYPGHFPAAIENHRQHAAFQVIRQMVDIGPRRVVIFRNRDLSANPSRSVRWRINETPSRIWSGTSPPAKSTKVGTRSMASVSSRQTVPRV